MCIVLFWMESFYKLDMVIVEACVILPTTYAVWNLIDALQEAG